MLRVFSASLLVVAACAPLDSPDDLGSEQSAIIGGTVDVADPAVIQFGGCTGTLVARRVVVTAAHCVEERILAGATSGGDVRFGTGGDDGFFATARIADMAMHRLHQPPMFTTYDIALIRLGEDPPPEVQPIEISYEPLDESYIGLPVRTVGFGFTNGETMEGFGTKRMIDLVVDELTFFNIGAGTSTRNICQGDSGGPSFATFDGVERVIAVSSYGAVGCQGRSYMSRTDPHRDNFLIPVIDAWDGPCQQDGACVTDGCRTVDPDCDVCGFDGVCGTDCAQVDLDCPVSGRPGDRCEDEFDCETRLCVDALDDPRIRYCSESCDPSLPAEQRCPPPLTSCQEYEGEPACFFFGTTPGAQGAVCEDGQDCRSGVCDPDDSICIEQCGDGLPGCADGYECQGFGDGQRACRVPTGGCAVGQRAACAGWALAVCAIVLGWRRRRR